MNPTKKEIERAAHAILKAEGMDYGKIDQHDWDVTLKLAEAALQTIIPSENSLRTVASHVKETDNYVLCVVTGDKEPMTAVVESEKSAPVYRELIRRLFDIQYEASGYEPDLAVDRMQSYFSELRAEWLSENSPEDKQK